MPIPRYASRSIESPEVSPCGMREDDNACSFPDGASVRTISGKDIDDSSQGYGQGCSHVRGGRGPAAGQVTVKPGCQIARISPGDELAKRYRFLRQRAAGVFPWVRFKFRFRIFSFRLFRDMPESWKASPLLFMLDAAGTDHLCGRLPAGRKAAMENAALPKHRRVGPRHGGRCPGRQLLGVEKT